MSEFPNFVNSKEDKGVTYFRVFVILCFVAALLFVIYLVVQVVPAMSNVFVYQRNRNSIEGNGAIWTQNIGGSNDEETIKVFEDEYTSNVVVFGNTESLDYDLETLNAGDNTQKSNTKRTDTRDTNSNKAGYIAILDKDGTTIEFVPLRQYGVGRIVKVIIADNFYFVLSDDGDGGDMVTLTKVSLDIGRIGLGNDTNNTRDVLNVAHNKAVSQDIIGETIQITTNPSNKNKFALDIFYNDDLTKPLLLVLIAERSTSQYDKIGFFAATIDINNQMEQMEQISDATTTNDEYSLLYIEGYYFQGNRLILFANRHNGSKIVHAVCIDFYIGYSGEINPIQLAKNLQYEALAIMPQNNGGYTIVCKALDNDDEISLQIISIKQDFNGVNNETILSQNPLSAKLIPAVTGYYLFVIFENGGKLFFGKDSNTNAIIVEEIGASDFVNDITKVTDYDHIDYFQNQLLVVGETKNDIFVLRLSGNTVMYKQKFGGGGIEQNARLLIGQNVEQGQGTNQRVVVAYDSTSGTLGNSDGIIPNNFGGSDTIAMKLDIAY